MQSLPKLISNLRELGFQISISEMIETSELLHIADSKAELRLGLRMILSKSLQEQELFDLAWESYYREEAEKLPPQDMPPEISPLGDFEGSDPVNSLIRFSSSYKGVVRQLLQGNDRNAAAIMLRYLMAGSYSIAELREKRFEIREEVAEMLNTIIPDSSEELLNRLDDQLNILMDERLQNPMNMGRNPLLVQNIEDLPLLHLDPSPELHLALRRLGRKLATKHKRRLRKGRKKINLRQTIRTNIQRGGVLLELRKQRPRLTKPRLIIITDVSPSTIHATRLFLSIIWNAKEVFSNIRFFEFIGSCIEVSNEFKRAKSVNEGMDVSLARWNKEIDGKENSDYYRAFRTFSKLCGALTKQTSIIILGDLRDWLGPWKAGKPLSASVLGELRQKVHRLIVLNPEAKNLWNSGDSICKHCEEEDIEVEEATTLAKLIDVLLSL
ncbi:MAG: VWA domain-containing protein [Candidatus Kariarchaeaceae archaeon]|jgi:uncharacterized protein with von Willebrand factor type A (vWA) domain